MPVGGLVVGVSIVGTFVGVSVGGAVGENGEGVQVGVCEAWSVGRCVFGAPARMPKLAVPCDSAGLRTRMGLSASVLSFQEAEGTLADCGLARVRSELAQAATGCAVSSLRGGPHSESAVTRHHDIHSSGPARPPGGGFDSEDPIASGRPEGRSHKWTVGPPGATLKATCACFIGPGCSTNHREPV